MAEIEAALPGTRETVEKALRTELEISDDAPLATHVQAEGKQIPLTFSVAGSGAKLPDAYGMTVTTKTVLVTATSPISLGFRQSVSPRADRAVRNRAEGLIARARQKLPAEPSVDRAYEVEYSIESSFGLARQDDIEAGILPFEFRNENPYAADGRGESDLFRKSDGAKIGTYRKWYHSGYRVTVNLTEATPEDARAVGAALRSWVRGQSMIDRPQFAEISF